MSFTIHSKLTDILNSILNMTGINQKEELKSVLINKGLTINDNNTLADMIIKLNTTNLGDAQQSDVLKGKTFTNEGHMSQLGTLDLSGLTPETLLQGITINGVTGILNPVKLEYNSSDYILEFNLSYIANRICEYDNLQRITKFKILYPGYFGVQFQINGNPHGSDKKFNVYRNGILVFTKFVNNDIDNDSSSGSVGIGALTFSANKDDIIEISGESMPIYEITLVTSVKLGYTINIAENANS